jgi:hypothetical protein
VLLVVALCCDEIFWGFLLPYEFLKAFVELAVGLGALGEVRDYRVCDPVDDWRVQPQQVPLVK